MTTNGRIRWAYGSCIGVSLMMMAWALYKWGAGEVRSNVGEVLFLTSIGGVWLTLANGLFSWFGLSVRDDAVERRNSSALIALCGAEAAVAVTYTGGSLGEGPSYLNNFVSVGLATVGLFGLWLLLELGGNVSVSIAEERNLAAGIRLGSFLLAVGLILGRAVAGNWHSEADTLRDFIHDGWVTAPFLVLGLFIEWFLRPSRQRPFPSWASCGLLPALIYFVLAAAWVRNLGSWEGMPK
jgi:hypothetical protein